jgi:hypothetical protein
MSTNGNIPNLERITFFNGQRLTAEDLTAVQNANQQLRALHNRSLHGWGIAAGFSVIGNQGDTAVEIGSGYAIDCQGREIILTNAVTKSVPAVASAADGTAATYYLVASYVDNSGQTVLQNRAGVCMPSGTVRLTEAPELTWVSPIDIDPTTQVILGQISVLNCQLSVPVNLAVRRFARVSSQPYIGAGETPVPSAMQPVWQLWQPGGGEGIGVICTVDTSAANFNTTPSYIAHIVGSRSWVLPSGAPGLLLPFTSVVNASPTNFQMQANLQSPLTLSDSTQWVNLANTVLFWQVVWMGIES